MEISSSPAHSLNSTDWLKGLRGSLITYAAGLLVQVLTDLSAYLQSCVDQAASCQVSFGAYDFLVPGVIAAVGFLLEMIRRYRADHSTR